MSTTVKGVYRDGHVVLLEIPKGVDEANVIVTFPDDVVLADEAAVTQAKRGFALTQLREGGWNLGGAPYPTRDELHDRAR